MSGVGLWLRGGEVCAAFPAGKGGCGGAVEPLDRGAGAGRGALSAGKMGSAALCCRSALAAEQGFVGFAVGGGYGAGQTAVAFGANGLFAPVAVLGSGEAKLSRVASRSVEWILAGRQSACFLRRVLVKCWWGFSP